MEFRLLWGNLNPKKFNGKSKFVIICDYILINYYINLKIFIIRYKNKEN